MHLPVLAAVRTPEGTIETPKAIVYGTAFPVAPGMFLTAGHVIKDARADGIPAMSVLRPGQRALVHEILDYELIDAIDLAILRCPSLQQLTPLEMDFNRPLELLMPAQAIGFPLAVDVEYVRIVARGFGGHVVTRREFYQLPGQPAGYELSFFAPQGLSGAPLLSIAYGPPRCYGYIIQQSTIGAGEHKVPVGIAVGIEALLSIGATSYTGGRPFAALFGREPIAPPARSLKQLPGGMKPLDASGLEGWPDDDLPNAG